MLGRRFGAVWWLEEIWCCLVVWGRFVVVWWLKEGLELCGGYGKLWREQVISNKFRGIIIYIDMFERSCD